MPTRTYATPVRLTQSAFPDYEPAWASDGAHIAFVSQRDGNPELYLVATNGTGLIRLTDTPGADRSPAFSPEGTKIFFASTPSGNFDLATDNSLPARRRK